MIAHEQIYDAALSDEAFVALPLTLASGLGGRSAVMHWRSTACAGELAHSNYFSQAQMDLLDQFDGEDLWAEALNTDMAQGRAWLCQTLVPEPVYERGRLYNEWVRPIGDDTFHALGSAFRSGDLVGEIGIHRARGQGAFDEHARRHLEQLLPALGRMMLMRSRLARCDQRGAVTEAALDASKEKILVLDGAGRLLHANRAGERMVAAGDVMVLVRGVLQARVSSQAARLEAAIRASREGTGETLAIVSQSGQPYSLTINPISVKGKRCAIVLVHTAAKSDLTGASRAAAMYGLSATERTIAAMLADGRTAKQIAEQRGTSVFTVRDQIKSVMQKMGVHRQTEIAAAVAGLSGSVSA